MVAPQAPSAGRAGAWSWRVETAPEGRGFQVRTWTGDDDPDCNPSRVHVFRLGQGDDGGFTVVTEADEMVEVEELGQDFGADFEELGQYFGAEFEELEGIELEVDEALEELESEADLEDMEVERLDRLGSATVVQGALPLLGGLRVPRVVLPEGVGQRYAALRSAGHTAVPAAQVEVRQAVSQMRSEVEALRAMLRELREEVESQRGRAR
jgi:hypothetical protein